MRIKLKQFCKILFVLFFFYHLVVIIVFANGSSVLGRRLGGYFTPYANALGLNTTWNFFSPDPAHTMFIKYETRYEDSEGNELKPSEIFYFPTEKDKIADSGVSRRFLYTMRFYILDQKKLKTFLAPWICRKHPGVTSVKIQFDIYKIPQLDYFDAVSSELSLSDSLEKIKYSQLIYDCMATQDEVAL